MAKSMVADNESGKGYLSKVRTSSDRKCRDDSDTDQGTSTIGSMNRIMTSLLRRRIRSKEATASLQFSCISPTDVKLGGETVFPNAQFGHLQFKDDTWSDCARTGLPEEKKVNSVQFDPTNVVQISWKPRIFLYKGFLSDEESDHLIYLAKKKLAKSTVADNESGESITSEVRTSSGMFLSKRQDEIVARIEDRIAAWTFLPQENAESIQILRYQHGQKYEPHFDFFQDKKNQERGGHRLATVLMYLSDVKFGGETVFPQAEFGHLQVKDETWSDCAKKGLAVKAVKGDAVLFFSLKPDGTTDSRSLHGSCPVIEGEKWSAPKWIHVGSFDKLYVSTDICSDENSNCPHWATAGECEKNPVYMLANCKRSCAVCDSKSDV